MLQKVKINKKFFKKFDQTCHIVYCPHSHFAAHQPNEIVSFLAGPLMHCLAGLICIVHPAGCTMGCVHIAGCATGCKVSTHKQTTMTSLPSCSDVPIE